jgi:hypothetical protein
MKMAEKRLVAQGNFLPVVRQLAVALPRRQALILPQGMSALGQKRSFVLDPPNVRFAPKAVIRLNPLA